MTERLENPLPLLTLEKTSLFVAEGQYWLGNNMSQIAIPMDDDLLDQFLYIIFMYIQTQGNADKAIETVVQEILENG